MPLAKIAYFNKIGLHYNLVADQIYNRRLEIGKPSIKSYQPFIIAGLIAFDIRRMMGADPYSVNGSGFASRLSNKLVQIQQVIEPLLMLTSFQLIYRNTKVISNKLMKYFQPAIKDLYTKIQRNHSMWALLRFSIVDPE